MLPYWYDAIVPDLAAGRTVLVVAHGNSIRALVKHLDEIGDAEIAGLDIPTGMPLVYEIDAAFRPRDPRRALPRPAGRGRGRRGGQEPGPVSCRVRPAASLAECRPATGGRGRRLSGE